MRVCVYVCVCERCKFFSVCESNIEQLIRIANILDDKSGSTFGCQWLKGTFQPIVTLS